MPKITRHTFTVEGIWNFPIDMLRYDACWPATETDSHVLADKDHKGPRKVELRTDNEHAPTDARWRSFMWKVISKG